MPRVPFESNHSVSEALLGLVLLVVAAGAARAQLVEAPGIEAPLADFRGLPPELCALMPTNLAIYDGLADVFDPLCPDRDGDGFTAFGGDCDDAEPTISPGMGETCANGVDENCDGQDDACEGVLLPGEVGALASEADRAGLSSCTSS